MLTTEITWLKHIWKQNLTVGDFLAHLSRQAHMVSL